MVDSNNVNKTKITPLLKTDRNRIRKYWNKNEEDLVEILDEIKEWILVMDFPEMPTDSMLEFFLTNCKYNIESTKQNISTYYGIRQKVPEIYKHSNPRLPEMQEAWNMGWATEVSNTFEMDNRRVDKSIIYVKKFQSDVMKVVWYPNNINFKPKVYCPLPQLTEDLYRMSIVKLNPYIAKFNANKHFAHFMNIYEARICEDLCLGEIVVMDYKELTWSHVFKFSPFIIKKIAYIMENVAKNRVKNIHFLNSPSYVNIVLNIAKRFIKKKIADRFVIHNSYESLYQCVSQEALPSDYGGNERSLDEINALWKRQLEKYQSRFDMWEKLDNE